MNKENGATDLLLIEDNGADLLLLQEVMAEYHPDILLHVVRDGEEAMGFLLRKGTYSEAVSPDLILLDLNLPRKDGFAVLSEIKQDTNLNHIPVIVFSTSQADDDINRSYRLQANCYITKPQNLEGFIRVLNNICTFWLETARMPKQR